jgi:hypothetical protein
MCAPAFCTASLAATTTCLAGEPLRIAEDVYDFAPLAGCRAVVQTGAGFISVDAATGESSPWAVDWDPAADGWLVPEEPDLQGVMSVESSPDGETVAVVLNVGVRAEPPDNEYPYYAPVVVLADADGSNARPVVLAEQRDGGPQLIFSQDSAKLFVNWPMYCEPSPESYIALIRSGYEVDESLQFNSIGVATGERRLIPGLVDALYFDPCPISDVALSDLLTDEPTMLFIDLATGNSPGSPVRGLDTYGGYSRWAGSDLLLINAEGKQLAVRTSGTVTELPDQRWQPMLPLPGGRSIFSRDGGATLLYGAANFEKRYLDDPVELPELAPFGEELGEDGWPVFTNRWRLMPDHETVLIWRAENQTLWSWGLP